MVRVLAGLVITAGRKGVTWCICSGWEFQIRAPRRATNICPGSIFSQSSSEGGRVEKSTAVR